MWENKPSRNRPLRNRPLRNRSLRNRSLRNRNEVISYNTVKSMHFTFLPVCLEIGIIDENIRKNIFEAQMEIFFAKKVTF